MEELVRRFGFLGIKNDVYLYMEFLEKIFSVPLEQLLDEIGSSPQFSDTFHELSKFYYEICFFELEKKYYIEYLEGWEEPTVQSEYSKLLGKAELLSKLTYLSFLRASISMLRHENIEEHKEEVEKMLETYREVMDEIRDKIYRKIF